MKAKQTFYFSDGPYLQTLQGLHAALSTPEAFIKLLGTARSGKSALCEKLSKYLRRKGFSVIYFQAAIESPDMLRSMLSRELDLPDSSNFPRLLEDSLQDKSNKPLILIFDDAHLLTDITLLEIYRLAEVQVDSKRILNIVLCGEPVLEKRLLTNQEFKSLLLNVSHRFVLEPMDSEALSQYFYKYVEKSGIPGLQLEPQAMNYFYKSCKGYPGPAKDMCRLMVESRIGETEMHPIDRSELVKMFKAAASNQTLPSGTAQESNRNGALLPLAAVIAIASVGFLYQQVLPAEDGLEGQLAATEIPQSIRPDTQQIAEEVSPFSEPTIENVVASVPLDVEVAAIDEVEVAVSIPLPANLAEPVSDSSLALVTAQERGVSTNIIVEPEFEPLAESAADSTAAAEMVPMAQESESAQPLLVASDSILVSEADVDEIVFDAGQSEVASETKALEASVLEVSAVEETSTLVEADETEVSSAEPAMAIEPTPEAEPVLVAANNPVVLSEPGTLADEGLSAESAESAESVENTESNETLAEATLPDVAELESAISHWVNVWQEKSLTEYFASYHSNFVPRYQDTQADWRSNRRRVIGNAEWIRLEMSEFALIGMEAGMIEVQVWLNYESPTYSDNTLKKLLLLEEGGEWRIMEEINLQVRG